MLGKIWVLALVGILSVASIHAQDEVEENSEVIEDDGESDVHVAALAKTSGPCACIETVDSGRSFCFRPACSDKRKNRIKNRKTAKPKRPKKNKNRRKN